MSPQVPLWRAIQKTNFYKIDALADFLELSEDQRYQLLQSPRFPLNLPKRLADKIKKRTLNDPILRQFVPIKQEIDLTEGFCTSPTQDESFSKTPKLLQKYNKRALLLVTSACAMHCRFCFRQNYPYDHKDMSFEQELKLIAEDASLMEIILSGGDPLSLSDEKLENLICGIEQIPHIKILRFHTRFPIGIPERVSENLLSILSRSPLQIIFVLHVNHPLELDEDVVASIKNLQKLGISTLAHTVLLKGVNDSLDILIELNTALISCGVIPYYLNQLDKVQGSAHFEVPKSHGLELVENLRNHLPGYAIPLYIEESPGKPSKSPITSYQAF